MQWMTGQGWNPDPSKECFHSYDQWPHWFTKTKDISHKKKFNSRGLVWYTNMAAMMWKCSKASWKHFSMNSNLIERTSYYLGWGHGQGRIKFLAAFFFFLFLGSWLSTHVQYIYIWQALSGSLDLARLLWPNKQNVVRQGSFTTTIISPFTTQRQLYGNWVF